MKQTNGGGETCIRAATAADARRVRAIERAAQRLFLDSPHPECADLDPIPCDRLRWQAESGWLYVAVDPDDRPVGFIACSVIDGDVFVEEVDVLPSHAGRRIGARLLDTVAAAARARGIRRVVLTTFADVPWNAPYYERLGFRPLSEPEWGPELVERVEEEDESGLDRAARVCLVRSVAP